MPSPTGRIHNFAGGAVVVVVYVLVVEVKVKVLVVKVLVVVVVVVVVVVRLLLSWITAGCSVMGPVFIPAASKQGQSWSYRIAVGMNAC